MNGLILGYLMYSSRLVPRGMAMLGLIGGPLIILSGIGVLFDAWDAGGTVQSIATIPEFLWELSLGIYCAVKGFRRDAPILSQATSRSLGTAPPWARSILICTYGDKNRPDLAGLDWRRWANPCSSTPRPARPPGIWRRLPGRLTFAPVSS